MKTYELTYIVSSDLNSEQADAKAKEIESFIQSREGTILKSERISIQTIAYPIKKQSSGYFGNLIFKVEEPARSATEVAGGNKVKEIKEKMEKDNKILRHLITIKKPAKPIRLLRTRRPLIKPLSIVNEESPFAKTSGGKSKTKSIDIDEIEKKLEEMF